MLFINTFRDGVNFTIQITMDKPKASSLSEFLLKEASWDKKVGENQTYITFSL